MSARSASEPAGAPALPLTAVQIGMAVVRGERPPLPADTPPYLRQLLVAMWAHEPTQRPRALEVASRLGAAYDGGEGVASGW